MLTKIRIIEILEEHNNRVLSMLKILKQRAITLTKWTPLLSQSSSIVSKLSKISLVLVDFGLSGEETVSCLIFKLKTTHRRGRRCSLQLQPSPQGFWTGHPRWHLPHLRCFGSVSTTQGDRPLPQGFPHTGSGWCSDSTPTLAALPDCTLSPKISGIGWGQLNNTAWTHQLEVVDLYESNIELVTVVGHLLQPLQHRAARLVARVWETISPPFLLSPALASFFPILKILMRRRWKYGNF